MSVSYTFAFCLLFCSLVGKALGGESDGYFVNPPPAAGDKDYSQNKIYSIGETIELQWITDFTHTSLNLWQQNLSDNTRPATLYSPVHRSQLPLSLLT